MAVIQYKENIDSTVTYHFIISITLRGLRTEVLMWWRIITILCPSYLCCCLQIIYLNVVNNFTEGFSKQSLQLKDQKHVFVFSSDSMGQT